MTKEKVKNIVLFIFIYAVFLLAWLFLFDLGADEIWVYGFSHNVRVGLVPYRDFNMVVTPLFPFLLSLPLHLADNILFYHLANALIPTILFFILRKRDSTCAWLFIFLLLFQPPTYNTLSILLFFILLEREKRKEKKEFWLGFLLGLIFLTKQSIGLFMLIPSIYMMFKDKKILFKRILGWFIPVLIFLSYLLLTNSLLPFLNYTVFGLFDFGKQNAIYDPWIIIVVALLITFFYRWFYLKKKNIEELYGVSFLILSYPMFNLVHVALASFPYLFILCSGKLKKYQKVVPVLMSILICSILLRGITYKVQNKESFEETSTKVLHYKLTSKGYRESIKAIIEYLKKVDGPFYIFSNKAYLIKLEGNFLVNKYDLINNGNMGYNGTLRYQQEITEVCKNEACTIVLSTTDVEKEITTQTSKELISYVITNYQEKEKVGDFTIYSNR